MHLFYTMYYAWKLLFILAFILYINVGLSNRPVQEQQMYNGQMLCMNSITTYEPY